MIFERHVCLKITDASGLVAGHVYPRMSCSGGFSVSFAKLQLQIPCGWRGALAQVGNQVIIPIVSFNAGVFSRLVYP